MCNPINSTILQKNYYFITEVGRLYCSFICTENADKSHYFFSPFGKKNNILSGKLFPQVETFNNPERNYEVRLPHLIKNTSKKHCTFSLQFLPESF